MSRNINVKTVLAISVLLAVVSLIAQPLPIQTLYAQNASSTNMSSIPTPTITEEQIKKAIISSVPMGRMGAPDELASAVLFLASDDSKFVTGIELFVDGGMAQV